MKIKTLYYIMLETKRKYDLSKDVFSSRSKAERLAKSLVKSGEVNFACVFEAIMVGNSNSGPFKYIGEIATLMIQPRMLNGKRVMTTVFSNTGPGSDFTNYLHSTLISSMHPGLSVIEGSTVWRGKYMEKCVYCNNEKSVVVFFDENNVLSTIGSDSSSIIDVDTVNTMPISEKLKKSFFEEINNYEEDLGKSTKKVLSKMVEIGMLSKEGFSYFTEEERCNMRKLLENAVRKEN